MTLPPESLAFLQELSENNTKDWFQANKKRYEIELKKPSQELAAALNEAVREISPSHALEKPNKALGRINRDIRFSKDKTPYNTHIRAGFHNQQLAKGTGAGFYVGFGPDGCGVGAGSWMPPKENVASLRTHIAANHELLSAALANLTGDYTELMGQKLKRVPKPWPADHPAGEYLKHKGMHIRLNWPVERVFADSFINDVATEFRRMLPLVQFLEVGLQG